MNRIEAPKYINTTDLNFKLPQLSEERLPNSVLMYSLNSGVQEVIQIEWIFTAGNSYEHKNMVASTATSLLKNGTKTKTAFELNEFFEQYGAFLNRACYNEIMVVSLSCMSKHLPILLPVVVEIFQESVFPQEELDLYIANSKQTLNVSLQKSDFVANRTIDTVLYGWHHPYAKMSQHEYLDALTREDLLIHYNDYIKNGRCIIMASGQVTDATQKLLATTFGNLPFRAMRKFHLLPNPFPKPEARGQQEIINDATSVQGSIRIAQPFPNRLHGHFKKMQVLNTVFGGYFGSRLMSNIREDKGYTYGIHSFMVNHIQVSGLMISTEAGKDVCKAAIKEVYNEMKILRDEIIPEDELQLVRNYLLGSILNDLDNPFQVIGRWKTYILNGLDETFFYEAIDTIKHVTAKELQELANVYYHPEKYFEIVVY
jgi:zinc protease